MQGEIPYHGDSQQNKHLRLETAKDRNTTNEILSRLIYDKEKFVRFEASKNPNLSGYEMQRALSNIDYPRLCGFANNSSAPPYILKQIARITINYRQSMFEGEILDIRILLARHRNLPYITLKELSFATIEELKGKYGRNYAERANDKERTLLNCLAIAQDRVERESIQPQNRVSSENYGSPRASLIRTLDEIWRRPGPETQK